MTQTRVALVSGANRGIGLEVAKRLARFGLLVAIGSRDAAKGRAAADIMASEGLEPAVVALDVTSDVSVAAAIAETERLFGRIDVLVNNAGVLLDRSPGRTLMTVAETPIETVARSFDVNALGPLRLMQAVLPIMQRGGYGRIVNVSSILGQISTMGGGSPGYRMSKAALNALTAATAAELGRGPILVNCCHPGWVRSTDMGGASADLSVAQATETIVWLATLPDDGPTGGFFFEKKPIAW